MKRLVRARRGAAGAGGRPGRPHEFPEHAPALPQRAQRRALMRDADVVLLLEVADPFGQFNTHQRSAHKLSAGREEGRQASSTSRCRTCIIRSNYQDFQRYLPVGPRDQRRCQASLPALIEEVRRRMTTSASARSPSAATKLARGARADAQRTRARRRRSAGMRARSPPRAWRWSSGRDQERALVARR